MAKRWGIYDLSDHSFVTGHTYVAELQASEDLDDQLPQVFVKCLGDMDPDRIEDKLQLLHPEPQVLVLADSDGNELARRVCDSAEPDEEDWGLMQELLDRINRTFTEE